MLACEAHGKVMERSQQSETTNSKTVSRQPGIRMSITDMTHMNDVQPIFGAKKVLVFLSVLWTTVTSGIN